MPVASVNTTSNNRTKSLVIIAVVAILAILSALFFIVLNQPQTPENKAAEPAATAPTAKPAERAVPAPDSGGACVAEAVCKWTVESRSTDTSVETGFIYEIRDETTGQIVKSGTTSTLSVSFPSVPGHSYTCVVTPTNICAKGDSAKAQASCIPKSTPTVIPSPTPTSAVSATPTPTGALTATPTPTPTGPITPSVTPTGTITPTRTPTPTEIIIVSVTNTPAPTSGVGPSATTTPVPPAAGVILPSIAILVFAGIVILLGLVF